MIASFSTRWACPLSSWPKEECSALSSDKCLNRLRENAQSVDFTVGDSTMYAKSNSMFGGKGHPGFRNVLFSPKYNGNSEKSSWNSHDVLIIRKVNPEFRKRFYIPKNPFRIIKKIHPGFRKVYSGLKKSSMAIQKSFIQNSEKCI